MNFSECTCCQRVPCGAGEVLGYHLLQFDIFKVKGDDINCGFYG